MATLNTVRPLDSDETPPATTLDLAAELLRRGRHIDYVVSDSAMWPLLRLRDRLHIEPAVAVTVGQLAAVLADGHLVIRRVVRVEARQAILRRDNGLQGDLSIAMPEVLGVVTRQALRWGWTMNHCSLSGRAIDRMAAWLSRSTRLPWRVLTAVAQLIRR